jgi:transcriptional regulator with XRE-family HTH domain
MFVRLALGWTQTELARAIEESNFNVSRWESGASRPRDVVSVVRRIVDATGVDRDWLMWGDLGDPVTPQFFDMELVAA